jgi:Transposase DNA-binding/Transposase DDE domain
MQEPLDHRSLAEEVANSNFDDQRLNRRLSLVVAALAANPEASLPRRFDSAGLEGAYRFFSNHRVMPSQILKPHFEATRQRSAGEDFIIAHDSTTFLFRSEGAREGLGRAKGSTKNGKQAFFFHCSLAIAADGSRRPLGVAAFKTWVRGTERSGIEYQRWEEQLRQASEQLDAKARAIHVMDREADDYQMFDALLRDKYRFVARALNDRNIESESGPGKLRAVLRLQPATAERDVPLTRRRVSNPNPRTNKIHPPRNGRTATLQYAAAPVTLKRPQTRRAYNTSPQETLTLNAVHVWEPNPPEGETPIEWFLYTTEPIETVEQQLAVVDYYRARWVIEEYFKAIKSGCKFEERQLEDYEGLTNLLAVFAPIAYQMLLLRSEARRIPDADARSVLSADQLDVLRVLGRLKLSHAPTVREAYLAVAALGGHIKWNGDPGWQTLAYGYEKLETLTAGWNAAKLQQSRDQ